MLSPHKKSLEKLVDANVSIHEKRKTLQKAQVGEGILKLASHLMIPLLTQALKRWKVNMAQFCIDVQSRQDEKGRKNEKALV